MKITLLQTEPLPTNGGRITKAQAELYNYMLQRLHHDCFPTLQECINAMRAKSPLPIIRRLQGLEQNGLVSLDN